MRYILIFFGLMCVVLGVLGIFLPILPTTPFLLLASWLFYKSSPKLRNWLLYHPQLGSYIRNYQIHKSIPLRAKVSSITMLWCTMLLSIFVFVPYLWVKILLFLIGVGVTFHILSFKTQKEPIEKSSDEELSNSNSAD